MAATGSCWSRTIQALAGWPVLINSTLVVSGYHLSLSNCPAPTYCYDDLSSKSINQSKTLFNFEFVDSKIAKISEENKSINN